MDGHCQTYYLPASHLIKMCKNQTSFVFENGLSIDTKLHVLDRGLVCIGSYFQAVFHLTHSSIGIIELRGVSPGIIVLDLEIIVRVSIF